MAAALNALTGLSNLGTIHIAVPAGAREDGVQACCQPHRMAGIQVSAERHQQAAGTPLPDPALQCRPLSQ